MAWGRGGAPENTRGIWRPQRLPRGDGHFVWRGCPGKADSGGVWGKRQGQDGVADTLEVK